MNKVRTLKRFQMLSELLTCSTHNRNLKAGMKAASAIVSLVG